MNKQTSKVWSFASDSNPNIEFNNGTQHWEVKELPGRVRFIAKSRSACQERERQNLQAD